MFKKEGIIISILKVFLLPYFIFLNKYFFDLKFLKYLFLISLNVGIVLKFFFILWHKKHLFFFKNFMGEKISLKYFRFIYYLIILILKYKIIFYKKIYKKKCFNFKKIFICLNCHINNLNQHNTNLYYKIPIIVNQNFKYIEYSLFLYKNFKRKSIYMNLITNYINLIDIFNLSYFFKCF